MNKAYQLPHDQPNPFAETANASGAAGENASPYAAGPIPAASVDPGPGAYQATLTPRPQWLLVLSGLSLLMALIAVPAAFVWLLPLGVVSLFLSSGAWTMARHDLRAMHYGAMEPSTRSEVRLALWLAIVATLLGMVSIGAWVWAMWLANS